VSYRAFPMNKYVAQRKVRQAKSLLGGDEEADAETQALVEEQERDGVQVYRESQFHASNPRFHHHYLNS
jgi:hypothetical protein